MFWNKEKRIERRRLRQFSVLKEMIKVKFKGWDVYVTPDYLLSDDLEDGIRMPMDAHVAEETVKELNMVLPNWELVDEIWEQADVRLNPKPLPPTSEMTKFSYFKKHDDIIEAQLRDIPKYRPGDLVAGHKKDVIWGRSKGRVKIYGWHRPDGKPIQPVSQAHGAYYKDYSHGVRGVFKYAFKGTSSMTNDELIQYIQGQLQ